MSATSYLADVFTRHQIHLQRLAGAERNRITPLLDQLLQSIRVELANLPGDYRTAQLLRTQALVEALTRDTLAEMGAQAVEQLQELAEYEEEFTVKALSQVANIGFDLPTPEQLSAAVTTSQTRLVTGKTITRATLPELWETLADSKAKEIGRIIQTGAVSGRTQMDMVRDIARNLKGRTKQQVSAVVRTSINHIATEARQATIKANSDIIDRVQWIATLDGRTSDVCRARDMQYYPIDSGPRPPAHYSCRSTVVPVVAEKYALKIKGARAGKDGPVDAKTTYNSWLKRQPEAFQDDVLGAARGKLFRSGGLSMDKFVDDEGRTLTLQQLREREPLAFDRAGL